MKKDRSLPITVSIIEDDGPTRRILAGWIRRAEGFRLVSEYANAEKALLDIPVQNPSVVLMDINLPRMSGIECVRQLKAALPQTQFVMLTVYEDADSIFNALAAGATGYLLKRTPRNELLAAITEVHAGGSPMTSNIARQVVRNFHLSHRQPEVRDDLSPREREVLDLLAQGDLYKEISDALGISVRTVSTHIRRIYEKLHVRSRGQAVAKYMHLEKAALDSRS